MNKKELLALNPSYIDTRLTGPEIFYLYKIFDGYWWYDISKLDRKNPPKYHPKLKSKLCSDLFLDSNSILKHENIRRIIANQLIWKYLSINLSGNNLGWKNPTHIAGIPDGAKLLGGDIARILGVKEIDLMKKDGKISLNTQLKVYKFAIFIEDVCVRGTALKEAVNAMLESDCRGQILPFVLSIVNRSGQTQIETSSGFIFNIFSLLSIKANEWKQSECPFCEADSEPIDNFKKRSTSAIA